MSIEEARAALQAEQGECWHERSGAEGRNHVMTKADAYALAVLDEAVSSANLILVKVAGEDPIMSGHTLRARIEALR